jgi:hypothetical protein
MANLYSSFILANLVTATTQASSYPAANLYNWSIGRPWRSTSLIQTDIDHTIPASTVQAVTIEDVNFSSCEVHVRQGAGAYALAGTLTTYPDKGGRRKGRYVVGGTANVTGIRYRIPAGAALDGAAFWRAARTMIFGVATALPPGPTWGYNPRLIKPVQATQIANGQRPKAKTGDHFHLIACKASPFGTEDWSVFLTAIAAGPCLFDMALAAPRQNHLWVVTLDSDELSNPITSPASEEIEFTLRELV